MASKMKNSELSGLNVFSYLGANPLASFSLTTIDRAPTSNDKENFNIGDIWIERDDGITPPFKSIWMLAKKDRIVATWIRFVTNQDAVQYNTDSGIAMPSVGIVEIKGGISSLLSTAGHDNTVTLQLQNGAAGSLLIGDTGAIAAWANLTSIGGTMVITNGTNTINIEAVGVGGTYLTILDTDSGTAIPVSQNIDFLGGANITTSAGGSTLTINLDNDVTIPGALTINSLSTGVVQTDGGGLISSISGADGQLLIDATAGTSSFTNITSSGATVTITNGANSIDLSAPTGTPIVDHIPFLATLASTVTKVLGTGIGTYLGADTVLTEIFDIGNDVFPGDGVGTAATFTAPNTAKYLLTVNVKYSSSLTVNYSANLVLKIITSNRTYITNITAKTSPGLEDIRSISVFADMDALDTATYFLSASESSGADINIEGAVVGIPVTWMSGYKTR